SRVSSGSLIVSTRGGSGFASSIGAPVTMSAFACASRSVTAPASVNARRRWPRPTHSFVKNRYFTACPPELLGRPQLLSRPQLGPYQNDTTAGRNLTVQARSRRRARGSCCGSPLPHVSCLAYVSSRAPVTKWLTRLRTYTFV